jgi:hypothetical protein
MKEPLRLAVITFLFLTCFLLTLFAFINWEVNPGNWTYLARVGFSISLVGSLILSLIMGVNANE